jgi:hypothetical protein
LTNIFKLLLKHQYQVLVLNGLSYVEIPCDVECTG